MAYNFCKIIRKCCECPCLKYKYELCLCGLDNGRDNSPKMIHDVEEGIDPNCPLKKVNYTLAVSER